MYHLATNTKAFTLVELSIVLVIIGLIVSGVVGGQALVHSAKLQKVASDFGKFRTVLNTFELQYDALPGDFSEAQSYWPSCDDQADNSNTCNGNGDGVTSGALTENFRAWQHLSLAKMLPRSYAGIAIGSTWTVIGENVPASPIPEMGYRIDSVQAVYGRSSSYISIGKIANNLIAGAAFSPKDTKSIDTKLDDGKPTTGRLLSEKGWITTSECISGDAYLLSNDDVVCRLLFYFQ